MRLHRQQYRHRSEVILDVMSRIQNALYTGGEGQKIYDKWFTQKIAPKGLNLNVPIGSELKNEFAKPSDSPDPDSYK